MRSLLLLLAGSLLAPTVESAQTAPTSAQPPAPPQAYTLNVHSQLVIEDVSVTDREGKPVTGLPESAFHVFDNNVPQSKFEFQERTEDATAAAPQQRATYTNGGLLTGDSTSVVLLIDPITVELQDQLYLRIQVLRFVDSLPPGALVSVFRTSNRGVPVELQSPTADHALVRQAVTSSIPVIARPIDNQFENAVNELKNLSELLRPYPGNKALFWLAGNFPLFVPPHAYSGNDNVERQEERTREAFRALQEARVAVYPIDARGVLQQGGFMTPQAMTEGDKQKWSQDPSYTPKVFTTELRGQYDIMDKLAATTGGVAFYENNAVAHVMSTALQIAQHTYTLSLRPQGAAQDGSWHAIRITVDGPYTVHYRTGYYAPQGSTSSSGSPALQTAKNDTPLMLIRPDPTDNALPLQFSVRILQGAKAGKNSTVNIRYVIPPSQLKFDSAGGEEQSRFRITALAYNGGGDVLGEASGVVQTHFSPQQRDLAARVGVPADQSIDVKRGAQYLILAVEDLKTHKVGTVQLQLAAAEPTAAVSNLQTPAAPRP